MQFPFTWRYFVGLTFVCVLLGGGADAQIDTASLTGRVEDPLGKNVADAKIQLVDVDRNAKLTARTNDSGLYIFPHIHPGRYRMQVSAPGYQTVDLRSITIYTQDDIQQNFRLALSPSGDSVLLMANGTPIHSTGSVGTVVDHELVGELPLNGRSFQTLFQLIPGVTIAPTTFASQGQIAVNGQRTDANYFAVDGVSANFAIAAGVDPGQSAGGWLPALSVFGSTNSLVSTEDVQEFAVLTSSYSAEFGSVPGGQVSIVTRSGTNKLAGNVFDYLRNDAFDANDWFSNHLGLKRAALRQNDFGGVVGGALVKDKTFFFVSLEGLQLRQPTSSSSEVPSLEVRSSAAQAVRPFLNAYPVPNGPDMGNGLASATYAFSNPSDLATVSFRLDHHFRQSVATFVRYAYSISDAQQRGAGANSLSAVTDTHFGLQTVTAGLTYELNPRLINDLRFNWSTSSGRSSNELDSFGGAIPIAQQLVFPPGFSAQTSLFQFIPALNPQAAGLQLGKNVSNTQAQVNIVDACSYQISGHLIKVGIDYRQLAPSVRPASYEQQSFFPDIRSALTNERLFAQILASVPMHARFETYSLFVEDTLRPLARLSTTFGLRWDLAPTPTIRGANGLQPFAVTGFSNLPTLSLAPQGTALYHSPKSNFAPRIGFAYETLRSPRIGSVLRGGMGVYYDLSDGPIGNNLSGLSFPFAAETFVSDASLPLSGRAASLPAITANPPFSLIQAYPPSLETPYSYHWNLSFDQAMGLAQTLDVSYVGAAGHRLLRTEEYTGGKGGVPIPFTQFLLTTNAGYSNFNSIQMRFERRAGRAHAVASYSLAQSLDNVSSDVEFKGIPGRFANPQHDYGPSDFDIRHTANLGLDYALPQAFGITEPLRSLVSGWSLDTVMVWRSPSPVNPAISRDIGFGFDDFRPDLAPGGPLYIYDRTLPGGRMINPAALVVPAAPRQGNLGRNFFRGFPLSQVDLAVRRSFRLSERTRFQTRIEAFNLLNHPNFGPPAAQLGTVEPTGQFIPEVGFGISHAPLAQSLQGGSLGSGFSPLYQIGAARSVQLALKVEF